ncbi:SDR family NAD(P)-dependent oxidoreductase [Streptomyces sp. NBC_00140]|uniref:SDR family NAD(P)-dependent oxidoreductase n=1 Tax=Streptomyces sp. NBC_00140 TaxID=2975664 RepID=UPI0022580B5C|nr:SDR family oxidoreductase [Streptomyces sp. NBC_00140]MCX5328069.1 SDR family oxidoreductase [Streptomyces sp. NBC_00140]
MRLEHKIAVVSGAAAGIGRAPAERFAAEGAQVYAADVAYSAPYDEGTIHHRPLDVRDLASWERLAAEVADAGGADILVNNAGMVGTYAGITDIDLKDWDNVIAVNQTGVFYGMRTFIPQMTDTGGSVVNVSSIWGAVGAAGVAAYTASKGAVTQMSKNAALTYAGQKVRVNSVHPGLIATPMIDAQDQAVSDTVIAATPLGRIGQPGEVANVILFLASDEASYVTGAQYMVDGGYTTP